MRKNKQSSTLTDIGCTAENPAGLVVGTCISALMEEVLYSKFINLQ